MTTLKLYGFWLNAIFSSYFCPFRCRFLWRYIQQDLGYTVLGACLHRYKQWYVMGLCEAGSAHGESLLHAIPPFQSLSISLILSTLFSSIIRFVLVSVWKVGVNCLMIFDRKYRAMVRSSSIRCKNKMTLASTHAGRGISKVIVPVEVVKLL